MRICYVIPVDLRQLTGVGGWARVFNVLRALQMLNMEISTLSIVPAGLQTSSIRNKNFRSSHSGKFDAHTISYKKDPSIFTSFKSMTDELVRCAKASDIILSHNPLFTTGLVPIITKKRHQKPIIIDYTDLNHPIIGLLPQFMEPHHIVENYVLRRCDHVMTISHFLRERALSFKKAYETTYLPAFVDTDIFKTDKTSREEIRNEYNCGTNPVIMYAGSFWKVEGLSYLIKAMTIVVNKCPDAKLVIIGGGYASAKENPMRMIRLLNLSRNVILVGIIPHSLIPKFLSAADVVVAPKIRCPVNEAAFPIKIVEYMAMGLPIVTTPVGDIRYVIKDGVSGMLARPEDSNDLAEKILKLLLDRELAKKLSCKAREIAVKSLSLNSASKVLRKVLFRIK